MPDPIPSTTSLSVAIDDPISADFQTACLAIKAACELGCTAAGQMLILQAIKNGDTFTAAVATGWTNFVKLFRRPAAQ